VGQQRRVRRVAAVHPADARLLRAERGRRARRGAVRGVLQPGGRRGRSGPCGRRPSSPLRRAPTARPSDAGVRRPSR
jgi:hypothetical protein